MNEKEGKLKEKIRLQFISNRWSQPSDLYPILDEAKQDYPQWQKPAHEAGQFPTSDELTSAIISHSLKVQAWVKCWFGEGVENED